MASIVTTIKVVQGLLSSCATAGVGASVSKFLPLTCVNEVLGCFAAIGAARQVPRKNEKQNPALSK